MTDVAKPTDGPKGIGGWLILPTIGTCLSPFFMAFATYQSAAALNSPVSSGLLFFIALEALFNLCLTIA